jgi:hypothetical protein
MQCANLHNNFFNVCGETKIFSVGMCVVRGFNLWHCAEFLHRVPQKNLAPYMQWTDIGDWSCNPSAPFSNPHNKPHSSSPTSVCLQHLIQYICSRSPYCRMHNVSELENDLLTFPSDGVATWNRLEGQTLYSMGLKHAAHSHVGKLCMFYKNTQQFKWSDISLLFVHIQPINQPK